MFHYSEIRGVETRLSLFLEVKSRLVGGGAVLGSGRKRRREKALYFKSEAREWEDGRYENVEWEAERRGKGIYSKFHPPRILFCFVFHSSKIRGLETSSFVSRSRKRAPPPHLLIVEWEEGRREKGTYSKFHPPEFCFVLYFFIRKSKE